MSKVVLFNGLDGTCNVTIDYEIVEDTLYFRETREYTNKKDLLFKDDTENTYKLDKENTKKLLDIISEKELKNKFNRLDSFYDFREFIDNNNLEHDFISIDK